MVKSTLSIGVAEELISAALYNLSTPARQPVAMGLRFYRNVCAVVAITNLGRSQIDYIIKVERKLSNGWPSYQEGIPVGVDSGARKLAARTDFHSGSAGDDLRAAVPMARLDFLLSQCPCS